MNWLKRMLRLDGRPERPVEIAGPAESLRAGYGCESRGDLQEAEAFYRRVPEGDSAYADALYFLGRIAAHDRREEEALALFQKAVEMHPGEAIYLFALAEALSRSSRWAEAVDVYRASLALLPDCTAMRNNYAVTLIELDRREEARVELERLQVLLPDRAEVHFNLAGIYREYGRPDEAIATYRRVLELTPGHAPTFSNLLLQLNYSANQDAAAIFREHRRFGEIFARRYEAPAPDPAWPRKLRVGYVSPDFRNHVVMRFLEPILERHDRAQFDVYCYYNHREKDSVTERLRKLAARWVDCEDLSDAELADRIRADRIDILVDLAGHTTGNSLLAMAMKPAPVQATYLGYPNTTGLGAVDLRITDAYADPPGESDRLSAERLVRIPGSYFCYRPSKMTPDVVPLPALASGAVTFGCFNNFAKITAQFQGAAAKVLAEIPGSRLLLKGRPLSFPHVAQTVRDRFQRAGIDPARLELRGWEPEGTDHLAIYGAVDIALDSFPYNGATTTCEAMWMGVPVVSLAGDRHAGRVGSSLLNAMGMGEYVAHDVDQYVAICARVAGDLSLLAQLRRDLRDRMRRSPLMDEARITRALEQAYVQAWESRARSNPVPRTTRENPAAELLADARRLRETARLTEARAACEKILQERPDHLEAVTLLWDLAFDAGAPGAATDWLNRAIGADNRVAGFHYMLGCVLQAQQKIDDAIASFRQALAHDPAHAKAHNNLGCTLEAAGDLASAAQCYRDAIGLDPDMAHAHYNLGNACRQLGDAKQAIEQIERALAIEPAHADWRSNLGSLQHEQLQLDDAISNLQKAIALDPGLDRAYSALGGALLLAGRVEEANAAFGKALELKPERADVESWSLLSLHYGLGENAPMIFDKHLAWARRHARGVPRATTHRGVGQDAGRRLNIGYVSPDVTQHLVASFIEPVLAARDRGEFSVFCYSSGRREDETTRRLRGHCDHWRDISLVSDMDAADRIRADGIDILVDLAGHTGGGRLLLFAWKPAPAQVTWLGYPNTTGMDTMDYRLTDAVADPPGRTERYHAEKLIRLPHGFLCYAPPRESPEVAEPAKIQAGRLMFACFNNLAKITSPMIALWAELLRGLPGARLLLKNYGLSAESARHELRARFLKNGIGAERLDLLPADRSIAQHLAQYRQVDIALDVFPYNGRSTTCEALWMGVPVVTLAGTTHVSRVSASILTSVGLPELIANTPGEYMEIATRLAVDVEKRRALRGGMRARMRSSPLLDAQGFSRALEAAYREMWAKA
jgi:predicted O-linked N-acetylglucosamine transferase (SPINDLY family)